MYAFGTACLFREAQSQVNCVVFGVMNAGPQWHGIKKAQDSLHLGTGNSHDLRLVGRVNINEHSVNYIHRHVVFKAICPPL